MIPYLVFWFCCGLAAGFIGEAKGRGIELFFFGLMFGPLGICWALIAGPMLECSHCGDERVMRLPKCPGCGADFAQN